MYEMCSDVQAEEHHTIRKMKVWRTFDMFYNAILISD